MTFCLNPVPEGAGCERWNVSAEVHAGRGPSGGAGRREARRCVGELQCSAGQLRPAWQPAQLVWDASAIALVQDFGFVGRQSTPVGQSDAHPLQDRHTDRCLCCTPSDRTRIESSIRSCHDSPRARSGPAQSRRCPRPSQPVEPLWTSPPKAAHGQAGEVGARPPSLPGPHRPSAAVDLRHQRTER